MSKPVVLVMGPLFAPTQNELESTFDCHRLWEAADKPALLRSLADRCRIVVTSGGRGIKADEMRLLPQLALVSCFGVGVDAVDTGYCREHGIVVTNTPDVLTDDVADMALALLLGSIRQIPAGDRFVREGRWLRGPMPLTRSLQRRKVGIVGLGRIGLAIARRCAAFDTEIAYFGPREKPAQPYRYFADVVAMADWADVLIAACPGGEATRHIVSRAAIEALGPDGVFVNIARGSVVDQAALIECLADGRLGGAGLDVFDDEPRVPQALIDLPQVVLHPHQGSGTVPTRTAMGRLTIDNVIAFTEGRPVLTRYEG
ncbi:MAG: 2-hydroxyacid dehydrogenase [Burkholderiaceae bacterium]